MSSYSVERVVADNPLYAVYGRQTGQLVCYAREPQLCQAIMAVGQKHQVDEAPAVARTRAGRRQQKAS